MRQCVVLSFLWAFPCFSFRVSIHPSCFLLNHAVTVTVTVLVPISCWIGLDWIIRCCGLVSTFLVPIPPPPVPPEAVLWIVIVAVVSVRFGRCCCCCCCCLSVVVRAGRIHTFYYALEWILFATTEEENSLCLLHLFVLCCHRSFLSFLAVAVVPSLHL